MAMMYLLDPEAGEERRRMIAKKAGQATLGAREAAESAMEKLADATSGIRSSSASAIGSGMSSISDASSGIFDKLRSGAGGMTSQALSAGEQLYASVRDKLADLRSDASDHASEHYDMARHAMHDARHRANVALGREREHHYLGQTTCALGSLALGAGLVWMFDPRLGRSRRAWLRDKSFHWMNETSDFFQKSGRHLTNKMKGRVAETRGFLRDKGLYPAQQQSDTAPSQEQSPSQAAM